jgi:hypothetical protein
MSDSPKNDISKVFVLLDSIKESKSKYIEIVNPSTDKAIMKIKLNIDEDGYMGFLDTFFDAGFKVRGIEKKDFDSLDTDDVIKFNL